MTSSSRTPLQRLAEAAGVQPSYLDNTGVMRFASPETLLAILQVISIDPKNPEAALKDLIQKKAERICEPVIVCWQNSHSAIKLNLKGGRHRDLKIQLQTENGEKSDLKPASLLRLARLATGYHKLKIESGNALSEALVISAPLKLFSPDEGVHQWGAFLPLYAAHSANSWGAGNFSDWKQLGKQIASKGGRVIGTLPILSAFLKYPTIDPSPYSPASRLFWNEFFIDVTAVPEFQNSTAARRLVASSEFNNRLRKFRDSEYVNYSEEWMLRERVLTILAREFFSSDSARRNLFDIYAKERPDLQDYAAFRAACDQRTTSWHNWPAQLKKGKIHATAYANERRDFYLYIQWLAQSQMDDLLATFKTDALRFYLDLPLGVNPDSFDAWRYQDFFANGASAGAPPDSFFTKGQDWGFAPLHPEKCREQHYRYVIDYLRFQMRHTGMLRIDHVMGLHRLYWVPRGLPASAGAYVCYPAEELYAILSVESQRNNTMLVGENLGTVPPEVNKSMDRHGMRRMYVLQYEQRPTGPLPKPPHLAVASLNTHDMPTFGSHWKGDDIADRADLGLISKKEIGKLKKDREQLRQSLIKFLKSKKLLVGAKPHLPDVVAATLKFLTQSPAETVLVNLEDLWLEKSPQNTPGTTNERINWRRKSKLTLEQIAANNQVNQILEAINAARRILPEPPRRKRRKSSSPRVA
jgi:4-alpha-glucanotransferase